MDPYTERENDIPRDDRAPGIVPDTAPNFASDLAPDDPPWDGLDENGAEAGTPGPSLIQAALREILFVFLPALALAVVIHLFLAQATVVYGQSMEPNLHDHQRLIIEKVSYRFREPTRTEIVVVDRPDMTEKLIKRVIGLPGDTLFIEGGIVFINGEPLEEPYVYNPDRRTEPSQVIPEGHYFVMGDNRGNSNDSRNFGAIPLDQLVGRAWVRYWPLTDFKLY